MVSHRDSSYKHKHEHTHSPVDRCCRLDPAVCSSALTSDKREAINHEDQTDLKQSNTDAWAAQMTHNMFQFKALHVFYSHPHDLLVLATTSYQLSVPRRANRQNYLLSNACCVSHEPNVNHCSSCLTVEISIYLNKGNKQLNVSVKSWMMMVILKGFSLGWCFHSDELISDELITLSNHSSVTHFDLSIWHPSVQEMTSANNKCLLHQIKKLELFVAPCWHHSSFWEFLQKIAKSHPQLLMLHV